MVRGKTKLLVGLLAVLILLVFLTRNRLFANFADGLLAPFQPVQTRLYQWTSQANRFVTGLFLARELEKSVAQLRHQVVSLSKENITLKELAVENDSLRKLINFNERTKPRDMVVGRVLGKSAYQPTVLIIDQGQLDGLADGQAVIVEDGILVGKLIRVDKFSSQVQLLTASESEFSAALETTNRPIGIAVGERGLSVKLELIPNDEDIKKDDLIITSGLDANIPAGLIIGRVEEVNRRENELFQEAILKTIIPIKNISLVAIIQ